MLIKRDKNKYSGLAVDLGGTEFSLHNKYIASCRYFIDAFSRLRTLSFILTLLSILTMNYVEFCHAFSSSIEMII
jgi:hypothetical protein